MPTIPECVVDVLDPVVTIGVVGTTAVGTFVGYIQYGFLGATLGCIGGMVGSVCVFGVLALLLAMHKEMIRIREALEAQQADPRGRPEGARKQGVGAAN